MSKLRQPLVRDHCVTLPDVGVPYGEFEVRRGKYRLVYQEDNNLVVYGPGDARDAYNIRIGQHERPILASQTSSSSSGVSGISRSNDGTWRIGGKIIAEHDEVQNTMCLDKEGDILYIIIDTEDEKKPTPVVKGNCAFLPDVNKFYGTFAVDAGRYRLVYQGDNNLVVYSDGSHAEWASNSVASSVTGIKRREQGGYWLIGNHVMNTGDVIPSAEHNAICLDAQGDIYFTQLDALGRPLSIAIGGDGSSSGTESIAIGRYAVEPPSCLVLKKEWQHIPAFHLQSPNGEWQTQYRPVSTLRVYDLRGADHFPRLRWQSRYEYSNIMREKDRFIFAPRSSLGSYQQVVGADAARICIQDDGEVVVINDAEAMGLAEPSGIIKSALHPMARVRE